MESDASGLTTATEMPSTVTLQPFGIRLTLSNSIHQPIECLSRIAASGFSTVIAQRAAKSSNIHSYRPRCVRTEMEAALGRMVHSVYGQISGVRELMLTRQPTLKKWPWRGPWSQRAFAEAIPRFSLDIVTVRVIDCETTSFIATGRD